MAASRLVDQAKRISAGGMSAEALYATGSDSTTMRPPAVVPPPSSSSFYWLVGASGSTTLGSHILNRDGRDASDTNETGKDFGFFNPLRQGTQALSCPYGHIDGRMDMHDHRGTAEASSKPGTITDTRKTALRCHTRHQASQQPGSDHRHGNIALKMERPSWTMRQCLATVLHKHYPSWHDRHMVRSSGSGSSRGLDPKKNQMICCLGHLGRLPRKPEPVGQAITFGVPAKMRPGALHCRLRSHAQTDPPLSQTVLTAS